MQAQKETTMQTVAPKQNQSVEQQIQNLRNVFADAPQMAKTALENKIRDLASHVSEPRSRMESAGRTGSRQGTVSELTLILQFAPGGARRLRALLQAQNGNFEDADKVGTVHDMRFVFIATTRSLSSPLPTTATGTPISTISQTKIPDIMDIAFSAFEGWPGIHSPEVKDWIAKHQLTAEGWFVANPNLTVAKTRRLEHVGKAVEGILDKIG